MKKIKIVFMSAVIVIASCKPVSAAKNDNIKQLVKQLNVYESSYITANKVSGNKKIKLTDKEMARAAALSISVNKLKPSKKGEFGGYVTFKLKNELLKKSALKSKMQTAIRLKRSFILDIGEAITDSLIIRLHII